MDERRQREILAKIAAAHKKRAQIGLNARQIKNITSRTVPPPPIKKQGEPVKRLTRNKKAVNLSNRSIDKPDEKRMSFFFSGSIGDVMALESFFTDEERLNLDILCYATQKHKEISQLFQSLPNYRDLKVHQPVWADFTKFWCFFTKADCIDRIRGSGTVPPPDLIRGQDWSINVKFPAIRNGTLKYNHSSFLTYKLADVDRFNLPDKYFAICPYSTDKRLVGRDFASEDWNACLTFLKSSGTKGVVLNSGNDIIPTSDDLINLSNLTTICEAVEILKGASGYIGIDSSLSVLAAKLFKYPNLIVKSRNDHCYQNKECYFAPQTNFNFMMKSISVPSGVTKDTNGKIELGNPLTIKCLSNLDDVCWAMTKINGLKEKYSIPWIKLKLHLPGDYRDGSTVAFAKRFNFIDEVVTERFDIHDSCTAKCHRLNYVQDGYDPITRELTMIPNRHIEWDGRLESYMKEVPCDWSFLNGTNYQRDPEGTNIAISLVRDGSLRGAPKSGYITVHLGSKTENTTGGMNRGNLWTIHNWRSLLHSLEAISSLPVYLVGGSEDKDYANEFMAETSTSVRRVTDLTGSLSLTATIEVLRHSSLHLSFASGLGVAATYMHTPTIMFWREPGNGLQTVPIYYFSKSFSTNWVPKSSINSSYCPATYGIDSTESVFNMATKIIGDGKWTV